MSRCRLVVTARGHSARVHGARDPSPESQAAIERFIDAAHEDMVRRRTVPEAASKANPKGNQDSF